MTDVGNGRRLASQYGKDLRYCYAWHKWLTWDGSRFAIDTGAEIEKRAKQTVRSIYAEAAKEEGSARRNALGRHAQASEQAHRIRAMIDLARSEPGIPVKPIELDVDHWLLNCTNGTLDLRTGTLREHDRRDLITKLCATSYDPAAECPTWRAFIERIFAGNAALIVYVRQILGYCLTGDVREQILPIAWGTGANGKSTLAGAIMAMLGNDYSIKAPRGFLDHKQGETHPTELADLFGVRFVAAIETGEGRRLDEVLIKELTGSDPIRARRMREDFWGFDPTHKILLATNHKPVIRGTDHAIWRRPKLIPFAVTITDDEKDPELPTKLAAELPGILAWCVQGCLDWQSLGLKEPNEVKVATAGYRAEQDVLAQFIAERCIVGTEYRAKAADLYANYKAWCNAEGLKAATKTWITQQLAERGHQIDNGRRWYDGIGIAEQTPQGGC
jgi:putative DNA primase/helicase